MSNYTTLPHSHHHTKPEQTHATPKHLVHVKRNTDALLSVENLLKSAFTRTIDRLFPYLITQLAMFVCLICAAFLNILNGGAHIFLYFMTNSLPLSIVSGLFFFILITVATAYVFGWAQLTSVSVLIAQKKESITTSFTQIKPHVWHFLIFQALLGMFLFGLLPLHIASLGITFILWHIWSMFSYFIFVEDQPYGLDSMWRSYHTINQRFWDVVGRVVILFLLYAIIMLILNMFAEQGSAVQVVQGLVGYITTPFTIAYVFELYKSLPRQKYARPEKNWVYASIAGWVLMGFMVISFIISLIQNPEQVLDLILTDEFQIMLEQMEQVF